VVVEGSDQANVVVRFRLRVGGVDERVVWRGCLCGVDLCGSIPAVAGVAASLSYTINPPSTNSRIVCRRKNRGGCGCSRW